MPTILGGSIPGAYFLMEIRKWHIFSSFIDMWQPLNAAKPRFLHVTLFENGVQGSRISNGSLLGKYLGYRMYVLFALTDRSLRWCINSGNPRMLPEAFVPEFESRRGEILGVVIQSRKVTRVRDIMNLFAKVKERVNY